MFFIVLTGCNKMVPVFVKATNTMEEAQEYLKGKATFDPYFGIPKNVMPGKDRERLKRLSIADIMEKYRCVCYTFLDEKLFRKLSSDACTCICNAFIFNRPDGDMIAIVNEISEKYIF